MTLDPTKPADSSPMNQAFSLVRANFQAIKDWLVVVDPDEDGKVQNAESADKIEGRLLGEERFQVSGNTMFNASVGPFERKRMQWFPVSIPPYHKLVLKRVRWFLASFAEPIIEVQGHISGVGPAVWQSSSGSGSATPDFIIGQTALHLGNAGLYVYVNMTENGTRDISGGGWWLDLVVEPL